MCTMRGLDRTKFPPLGSNAESWIKHSQNPMIGDI